MDQQSRPAREADKQKKPYAKPELVVYGTIAELTQAGGDRRRDALLTRAPS
jgi:hypothetical protein